MPRAKPRASDVKVATVAIVGRPNVGKSTLLNALVGQHLAITSHHPQTTRERVLGVHTEDDLQLVLTDTPGVHTAKNKLGTFMNQEAGAAAEGGDVIVFVTDVRAKVAPEVREEDLAVLRTFPPGARVVLALNKVDLVKDKAALLPHLEAWGKAFPFVDVVPISAKRRDGSERLVEVLRGLAAPGPKLFDDDTLSDRPTRYFVAEFVRGEVLRKTRQEVPHGVAVVVERWAEVRGMPHIDIAIIVDKESHKKIVVGHLGARIKEIGAAARAKVEALVGQQVHLQLWVRVVPRWYESPQRLAELGYAGAPTGEEES